MKTFTREEVFQLYEENFPNVRTFQKSGRFICRDGVMGETILTIVAGRLETIKTISEPCMVVQNLNLGQSAEIYAISTPKFLDRYNYTGQSFLIGKEYWKEISAKGKIDAFEYKGSEIEIIASWGEAMEVKEGDFIGRPTGGDPTDIYRVERDTFLKTYKVI